MTIHVYSQVNMQNEKYTLMASPEINDINTPSAMGGGDVLWSEDFGDSNIPNIEIVDVAGYGNWHWGTESPQGMWSTNTQIIDSETPNNGFMIIEADFNNSCPQNEIECVDANNDGINDVIGEFQLNAHFTIGPIDLSEAPTDQLVLEFYSDFRICCYQPGNGSNDLNIYISTDGGNNFSDLDYIEGDIYEVNVQTATLSQVPLSGFSANTDSVYFRFEWLGTHYYWMIDDLSITQRPAYDLKMQSSWITMEDPAGIEYYAIPKNQMPEEMLIGAEVYNYGYNDDYGVTLQGSIEGMPDMDYEIEYEVIESDSTDYIETAYFDVSMLDAGTYTFTANVTSSGDDLSADNELSREFEISENVYALDGLYDSYEWVGPGWTDDGFDGVMFGNYFDIKETTTLSSIEIVLDTVTHPTGAGLFETNPYGEVIAYVLDTTGINDYFQGVTSELQNYMGGVVWMSDFYLVSPDDIENERIVIDADEFELSPNAYYIALEVYSNGGANNIFLYDDTSVLQPYYASMFFSPTDGTWYSNPNALSMRLGLDGFENTNVVENALNNIQYYPNPAKNYLEITSDKLLDGESNLIIYNILGETMRNYQYSNFGHKQQVNIEGLASGSYIIELENKSQTSRHKLIIE